MPNLTLKNKLIFIVLGIFCCFLLLESGLRAAGWAWLFLQEHGNSLSIRQKSDLRVMCIGESTTAFGYTQFLEEFLNKNSLGLKFSVINKGVGGYDSGKIISSLEDNLDKYAPDIVISMMGVNDNENTLAYGTYPDAPAYVYFFNSLRTVKLARAIKSRLAEKNPLAEILLKQSHQTPPPKPGKTSADEETELKEAIRLNNSDPQGYFNLGWWYRNKERHNEAEEMLEKAAELNTDIELVYVGLDEYYSQRGEFEKSESMLKKALKNNPGNYQAAVLLSRCYIRQNKLNEADKLFQELTGSPLESNERLCGALAILMEENKQYNLAKEYFDKADHFRQINLPAATRINYQMLRDIAAKKQIKLFCAQYPMRPLSSLQTVFKNASGIIFVDNEHIFRDAVRRGSYKEYFIDNFGGDFGHGTEKGNRMLAENIGRSILSQCLADRQK